MMHGGKTPRAMALPQTTHGRYSKDLPSRLAATYEAARNDPDLLILRDEIALTDSLISDLIKRLDTGESGAIWKQLQAKCQEWQKAKAGQRSDQGTVLFLEGQLEDLIEAGMGEYAIYGELSQLIDRRSRLVDRETKRLQAAQQTITVEQALLLIGQLGQIIREHVSDAHTRAAIQFSIDRLVAGPAG